MNKAFAREMRNLRREKVIALVKDFKKQFTTQQNPIPEPIKGQQPKALLMVRRGRFIGK